MPDNDITPSLTDNLNVSNAIIEQTPDNSAPSVSGEDTPGTTTDPSQPQAAQEAAPEKDEKTFVSGSAKARKLGESRRKMAEVLLKTAKDSQDVREQVRQMCTTEPDLDKYLQKYFKKDYEVIFRDRLESEVEAEEVEARDKSKAIARAELLIEQIKEEKNEQIWDFAHKLHFTNSEAKALQDMVTRLEGQTIGDEEIDFNEALRRAAYTVRPDKAKVGVTSFPSGQSAPQIERVEISSQHEALAQRAKSLRGAKMKDTLENLKLVEKHYKDNVFTFPMDE